jgi:hypothetical protein
LDGKKLSMEDLFGLKRDVTVKNAGIDAAENPAFGLLEENVEGQFQRNFLDPHLLLEFPGRRRFPVLVGRNNASHGDAVYIL